MASPEQAALPKPDGAVGGDFSGSRTRASRAVVHVPVSSGRDQPRLSYGRAFPPAANVSSSPSR
ncbi:MAG: hypothetical protein FJ144_07320 [Deltaproteobacteria bacterium]|nr:hypothetical protein [Deltaproteobacteria bacterium]